MNWISLSSEEKEILNAICNGSFQLSGHAWMRLGERALDIVDIIQCAETAENVEFQSSNGRYVIYGTDTLDCDMAIVAEYFEGVLIVTVW